MTQPHLVSNYLKKIFYIIIATFVLASFILTFVQDAQAKSTKIYKNKREYVSLKTKKSENFSHPYSITQKELEEILTQVKFKHAKYVMWNLSAADPAFTNRQINLLSVNASKALAQAKDNEYVSFFFSTPTREFRRYTKGKLFVYNNELHIIFDRLYEAGADNDPGKYQHGNGTWELVAAGKGQRIVTNKFGSKQKNWIVLSLNK